MVKALKFLAVMALSANAIAAPFTGSYIGVDAGPAWAKSTYRTNPACQTATSNNVYCNSSPSPTSANGVAVQNSGSGTFDFRRFNYDIHAGHSWNVKNIILGGEAEFGGLSLGQSQTVTGTFPVPFLGNTYTLYNAMATNWLASLRARAGVVLKQQFLLYATGGLAFTDLKLTSSYNDNAIGFGFPGGAGRASKSAFRTGWVLGGGGEWQFNDAYSLDLEYFFVKFSAMNLPVPISNTPAFQQTIVTSANLQTQILRVGINYRF